MGDLVYFGSCDGILHALELSTGRVRWETKLSSDSGKYFFHGDAFVAGDVIVVGADRDPVSSIHAVDLASGKPRWSYAVGRGVKGPLAGSRDRVYAARFEGQLLALDAVSGSVRWTVDLKVPAWEGPAATAGRVFAGTDAGTVHALNAESGREEWRATLSAAVSTTVSLSGSDLYAGTADGAMHRIDVQGGRLLATRKPDPSLKPTSVPVRTPDSVLALLVDQSADYRALVAMDPNLDKILWRASAEKSWSTSRIFQWGDVIVLGTAAGRIEAYCTKTGVPAWSRQVEGTVRSIGGAANMLLAGTTAGDLYALHAPRSCDAK